jgi:fatty-acyl-CoA synthase
MSERFDAQTLPAVLEGSAARFPDCLIDFPVAKTAIRLHDLARSARAFAARARNQGVVAGEVVGILLPPTPEFFISLFGVMYAGAAVAVLPPPIVFGAASAYTERLKSILTDAQIRFAAVDAKLADAIPSDMANPVRFLEGSGQGLEAAAASDSPLPSIGPEQLALVQYTSGTTTQPKGVALTHQNVVASLRAIAAGFACSSRDVFGHWLPLHHDMGLIGSLTSISCGTPLHVWPPSKFNRNPAAWLLEFAARRCTVSAAPNFAYAHMLAAADEQLLATCDLSPWRIAFNGAEPIDPACVEGFARAFARAGFRPQTMFPVYGLAEVTLAATFPALGSAPRTVWVDRDRLANDRRAVATPRTSGRARGVVSVGRAVLDHEVRIVDESCRPMVEGIVGEIQVKGPAVMTGYYRNPEATRAAFADGWLRTGDLGFLYEGELFVTGRRKEMIIVSGVNYYAEDVEAAFRRVPGVYHERGVALSVGDGDRMAVLVETRLGERARLSDLAERIRNGVNTTLGLERIDVYLVRRGAIRRTTSGKPQRALMRNLLIDGQLGPDMLATLHS